MNKQEGLSEYFAKRRTLGQPSRAYWTYTPTIHRLLTVPNKLGPAQDELKLCDRCGWERLPGDIFQIRQGKRGAEVFEDYVIPPIPQSQTVNFCEVSIDTSYTNPDVYLLKDHQGYRDTQ